jgi:UDP-N-acetylmuramoyl-L-alanine---L-glutamate ligase
MEQKNTIRDEYNGRAARPASNGMKKIAIAGFGMEGRAVYEYFRGTAEIHIFDEQAQSLGDTDAEFHMGLNIPADVEVVYKSPGIPTSKLSLESPSTRISTFMDIVLEKVGSRAIGVTGTKGKSTVASLIEHILKSVGRQVVLFGNIGVADVSMLLNSPSDAVFVLEMSSYQCEHITRSPHIAVFTNFYPEHLNHHGSLEQYREAKKNIARFQTADDVCINGSSEELLFGGKKIAPDFSARFETKLLGKHNQRNCALALTAVQAIGISEADARRHIASFTPLQYRLENIGEWNGRTFYDDSLATIPEATLASIYALPRVDTLILGGENRGISFDAFATELASTGIQNFIIFPETGSLMVSRITGCNIIPVFSMESAVREAFRCTPEGGVVLLSNASPSFNMFKDYKDKSVQYRHWVQTLAKI